MKQCSRETVNGKESGWRKAEKAAIPLYRDSVAHSEANARPSLYTAVRRSFSIFPRPEFSLHLHALLRRAECIAGQPVAEAHTRKMREWRLASFVMHRERTVSLFETERLVARKLSHQDVPVLTTMLSDPEVMKFSVRGVCDEEATRKFVDWCLKCYASHGIGPWALCEKASGHFI